MKEISRKDNCVGAIKEIFADHKSKVERN